MAAAGKQGRNTNSLKFHKAGLIQDLATGKWRQRELAEKYGVTQPAIHNFAVRFEAEIAEVAAGLRAALDHLWITDKENRVGFYQELAEDARDDAQDLDLSPADRSAARKDAARLARAVAEEMPDGLPARTQVQISGHVDYTINGAEPGAFS